jgi:hypothetical protein
VTLQGPPFDPFEHFPRSRESTIDGASFPDSVLHEGFPSMCQDVDEGSICVDLRCFLRLGPCSHVERRSIYSSAEASPSRWSGSSSATSSHARVNS